MPGPGGAPSRFPDEGPRALFALRDGHFWFEHRRSAIVAAARECLGGGGGAGGPLVLDLGCGDGEVLSELSRWSHAVGLDPRLGDLALARRRGADRLIAAEGARLPFRPGFDLVGLFDVVEHVEDDAGLLRTAASLVRPGGFVLLTVPADPRLWSDLDRYAGHHRRYTRTGIEGLLQRADLQTIRVSPLFRILWPLARARALWRREQEVTDPGREYTVPSPFNALLRTALALERGLFGRSERGAGTSWLAVARKQAPSPSGSEGARGVSPRLMEGRPRPEAAPREASGRQG